MTWSMESVQEVQAAGLERLFSAVSPPVARILDKALAGGEVTAEEGEILFHTQGLDLIALVATADELRRRTVGDRVTFVQTRNINFTNVCYTGCRFCAFGKPRTDPEAVTLSVEEVVRRAREARAWGCTEVCMQGGLNPFLPATIYEDLIRAIKAEVPDIHIHAFSPFEIWYASHRLRLPVREVLLRWKEAGLGSIPGTAAEILDPEVRQRLTKNKLSADMWEHIVKTAHEIGLRSTATIMYGHIDTPRHWARHIDRIRRIQRETGGFTEFVPLGFIHENTRLYLEDGARPGPTGMEDLKMHAVARLMLNQDIPNIQVSWVKLGYKMAQVCLNAGANDFGGTLHDENISRAAGKTQGTYTSPETFCRLIRDMGRIPAERTTLYEILWEGEPPFRAGAAGAGTPGMTSDAMQATSP